MEIDYTIGIPEKDLKLYRTYMNSKIDIYQDNDSYVFRNESKTNQKYFESFEHRQIQNEAAKILSSSSNLLVYMLGKSENDLKKIERRMIKSFSQSEIEKNSKNIEKEYNQFKTKVMQKKLENDREYKSLCDLINHPLFHQVMTRDKSFLIYILNHKYFPYHPRYEEIQGKYTKYLCPETANNESEEDENEEMEEEN